MTTPTGPIIILGTGGTISCTHAPDGSLQPTFTTAKLVAQAGLTSLAVNNLAVNNIECRDIMQLDSSNITLADIDVLVTTIEALIAEGAAGIVLLHGTDTLEETAMVLHRFFTGTIPIAITGAQRPADDPNPDGPANLRDAYAAVHTSINSGVNSANTGEQSTPEVLIVFGGDTFGAYGATKRHTTDTRAFTNTFLGRTPNRLPTPAPLTGLNVAIITTYSQSHPSLIPPNLDGLIIAAMGSGNVPATIAEVLPSLSCPVTICTRVPEGSVHFVYGGAGGGAELERLGMRSGGSLRPSQARMELLCELAVARAQATRTI